MSAEPPVNEENDPDWDGLRAACAEAERLIKRGRWTKANRARVFEKGRVACRGHEMFLEGLELVDRLSRIKR